MRLLRRRPWVPIAAGLLLSLLAGCRLEPPRGVVYVVDDDFTTRAYYRAIVDADNLTLGAAVELPLEHPVDLPAFTPAGDELWAFSADADDNPGLYRLAFDDAGPVGAPERLIDLTPYPAAAASAAQPAGGGRVFFDARVPETDSWQLFVYEDGDVVQLTAGAADREIPVVSPDGARLVFSTNDDGAGGRGDDYDLWTYELAAGELKPLLVLPGDQGSPSFGPDGALYFNSTAADAADNNAEFDLARLDELEVPKPGDIDYLPDLGGLEIFPRPAGDGRLLLVSVLTDDGWNAVIYDLENETSRTLGHPDGPQIIYAGWRPPAPTE
ncbi:MAG: hypothetical protein GF399_12365 [Candidatus Coatesbacteria bacterium]|nr:hypothetical protein [Candidatus Coatesbacteria bacterium]